MNSFKILVGDVRYQGAWLAHGEVLEVRSDYGATTVPLAGRDPATVARQVLLQLARVEEPQASPRASAQG